MKGKMTLIFAALLAFFTVLPANAQRRPRGRYIPPRPTYDRNIRSSRSYGIVPNTYDLNYLEVPLVLKYSAYVAPATAVEPFIGGYIGCGIGGKVKDYHARDAYSSFSDGYGANFKRMDGGIRVGCGLAYEMLYAEVGYDFGLTNIGDNAFDDTHNGALFLNIGLNF